MLEASINVTSMIYSPVRKIKARVELYEGSTLANTFNYDDKLISFTVERVNEDGKFFGFGICQKLNVKLIDKLRELNITTANSIKISFGVNDEYVYPLPTFYVTEVHRDENTNALSVTAYDLIYKAPTHTVAEIELQGYTIQEFAADAARVLGANALDFQRVADTEMCLTLSYEESANFEGTENLRDALNAIAEATQTIYFIDYNDNLIFKRLDKNAGADFTLSKDVYIELDSSTSRRLGTIFHATELGDDVYASTEASGSTQYVRDNPFWDLREDIGDIVDNALAAVGGLTINQFNCEWRGSFLTEPGDKLAIVTKDDSVVYSYILNDTLEYDGTFSEKTEWSYVNNDTETANNPTSLRDALKQTFARVDKVNKQIDLVVSDNEVNKSTLTQIQLDNEKITASVQQIQTNVNNSIGEVNSELQDIKNKVDATMTAEDIKITIQEEISSGGGVTSVTTETGFIFNDEGLTIDKTDSEMSTIITDDGMTVYRNDDPVLTANNQGVKAANLHATTYLIIGTYSRFEDYINDDGEARTGCFWIG